MKTLIAAVVLTFSSLAIAGPHGHGHRHHGHHYHRHHGQFHHGWVWPALIGGAVVYAATRPDPVVIQQPPVVLQPNQVIIDGVVYTKQYVIMNGVQTEVLVRQ
jgi:hypothetical protein